MTTGLTQDGFDTRGFVAAIRAGLDAAGRRDVGISRAWIDRDTRGETLLVHVPVGPELTVALRPRSAFADGLDAGELAREVDSYVKALINLKRAEASLARYASTTARAARRAIEAARAEGLDVQLAGVGFKPVRAWHLSGSDWRDAAEHVVASVAVRRTSLNLRPETSTFVAGNPEELVDELARILDEQRERQSRLAELEALGADLVVDAITLDILQACGLDAAELLSRVWREQCVNIEPPAGCGASMLSIISSDGHAIASVAIGDGAAFWNGEVLWFLDDARATGMTGMVGGTLGDRLPHPAFTSRAIVRVDPCHPAGRELVHLDLSDKLLFDADTGRTWRAERRLAA